MDHTNRAAAVAEKDEVRAEQVRNRAVNTIPRKPGYDLIKRLFDVVFSALAIVMLSPLMIVTALAIVIDDPKGGPVFTQVRVGKGGKEFKFYKFRSMVVNADAMKESLAALNEMDGPVFKIRNDPRVTKVGRIIRKTSVDELLQLWNVLKGDMSIVGPRPPLPKEVAQYTEDQMRRLSVPGGLTCYWQCRGRSNVGFDEWMEMDIQYIADRGIWTDLKIIAKTFGAVIRMAGAQ